jgi:serine/threonine protein kinase
MDDEHLDIASTMAALGQTQLSAPAASGDVVAPARLSAVRFSRVGPLGKGGMGVVDCVWDSDLLRELAVKRVRPELRADDRAVAMFLWEARVTAYLDHPNIVPVHDLGRSPAGDPYFAMKRVAGASFEDVLRTLRASDPDATVRWTLARRLRAIHQVCQAVAFAHRRGVLHRDLKPGNIMLGEAGEVMVMDWGLAIPVPGEAGDRLRTVVPGGVDTASAGTPLYMSPEQARGEALDERSDVYALGIILYELATLMRPYEGGPDVIAQVSRGATRPVREASPQLSAALAAVIECAIRPERGERYASVQDLADDLERVIDGKSPIAEHATGLRQLARFYMSHDRRIAKLRVIDIDMIAASATGVGFAIGAVLAGVVGSWWWIALVLAAIAAVRPIVTWNRAQRGGEL